MTDLRGVNGGYSGVGNGGNLLSYQPLSARVVINVNENRTIHNVFGLDADFDLFRIAFVNDTATPYTVSSVVAAAVGSVNAAGNYAPVDTSGAAVPWTAVTFDGGGLPENPLLAPGTTLSVEVPAAVANGGNSTQVVQGYAWSDWIRLPSIPPSDGSRHRLLAIRTFNSADGTSRAISGAAAPGLGWNQSSVARGRIVTTALSVGDTTGSTTMTSPTIGSQCCPAIIQTYSRRRGLTIMGIGDSLTQGIDTVAENNCWGHVASSLMSTENLPVTFVNCGHGGSTSLNYYRRALNLLPIIRPHIVTIACWTPNDPDTIPDADLGWSYAMELVDQSFRLGALPVIFGCARWFPRTPSQDADEVVRQYIRSRFNDLQASGAMPTLDPDAVLGLRGSPRQPNPLYIVGDPNYHFNDAGHALLGQTLEATLRGWIS